MSKTIPSGANWRQQIPGKQILTCYAHILPRAKCVSANTSHAVTVKCFKYESLNFMEESCGR